MRCPKCGKNVELQKKQVGVDESGTPVFNEYAICKDCKKQWNLDKQRAKKAENNHASNNTEPAPAKADPAKPQAEKKVLANTSKKMQTQEKATAPIAVSPEKKIPAAKKPSAPSSRNASGTVKSPDRRYGNVPPEKIRAKKEMAVKQNYEDMLAADADRKPAGKKKTAPEQSSVPKKRPVSSQTAAKKGPVSSQTVVKKEPVSSQPAAKKEPVSSQAAAKKGSVSSQPAAKKEPVSSQAAAKKEPVSSQAAAKKGSVSSQAAAKKGSVSSQPAAKKESVSSQTAAKKRPVSSQAAAKKRPVSSQAAAKKRPAVQPKRASVKKEEPLPKFRGLRIIFGILSIAAFGFFAYKAFITGLSNISSGNKTSTGTTFIVLALCMLVSGLLLLIMQKKRSIFAFILPFIFYIGGAVFAFLKRGNDKWLIFGAVIGAVLGIIFIVLTIASASRDEKDYESDYYDAFEDDDY